jgi:hypothetical protein
MVLQGIRFENGNILVDGYPEGATVHGIGGPLAEELRRLSAFRGELQAAARWLALIPNDAPTSPSDQAHIFVGLTDAALLAFCRCFDFDRPLKPLKLKGMLSAEQRDQLERLRAVRNRLIAHDTQVSNGLISLIVMSREKTAIKAVSLSLDIPFLFLPELSILRTLSEFVLDWVKREHGRVATETVRAFNAMPLADRAAAPPFTIKVEGKDHFAPKALAASVQGGQEVLQ